ncbi:hypothetical protein TNCV_2489871 [Trichonephila clavipes]|nr:hypothetical protein TNCV_2489871 [Trichonephila clavipes]
MEYLAYETHVETAEDCKVRIVGAADKRRHKESSRGCSSRSSAGVAFAMTCVVASAQKQFVNNLLQSKQTTSGASLSPVLINPKAGN